MKQSESPLLEVKELTFRYRPDDPPALDRVSLTLKPGERCLLVGANGAGKTTLLRMAAGKHLLPAGQVQVLGRSAFHDTSLASEVSYIGGPFPFAVDVQVGQMLGTLGADPARRQRLVQLLGVEMDWHMHRISDGQRRRVQLLMGLLMPYRLLLLDEATSDLDLLARAELLDFFRQESEQRGVAILYATHILDRMETWATDLVLLHDGELLRKEKLSSLAQLEQLREKGSVFPLSQLVEGWMRSAAQR